MASTQRQRKHTRSYEDHDWLEDATFISADCFTPPPPKAQPRAWGRIVVPTAIASRSDQRIHKRVSAKPVVDQSYRAVVAELESQSLDSRKRARLGPYVVPYGGAQFKDEIRPDVTGQQDLSEAREHVETSLLSIWSDNVRLQNDLACQKANRPSFDPAQLSWIPRKRHNTRWPVNPPNEHSAFIAKLQPLIRFELQSSQVDEVGVFDQEESSMQAGAEDSGCLPINVPQSQRELAPQEPAQKPKREKSSHRRRTLRPSLSTISEAADETAVFPFATPGSSRSTYRSPAKRWQANADTARTPTKIAESSMKDFTMSAMPKAGEFEVTNQSHMDMVPPSPFHKESNTASDNKSTPVTNSADNVDALAALDTESSATPTPRFNSTSRVHISSTPRSDSIHTTAESSNTYVEALPFFDQPIPEVQVEPEHEARRRFSLDNARRSDRGSNVKIVKRVHNWMAGTSVGKKRRYSDTGRMTGLHQEAKRRHTLDVDAGLNSDIFGQLQALQAPVQAPIPPVEIFHRQTETLQEHVSANPPMAVKEPATSSDETLTQDPDVADSESEETVENTESEGNEDSVQSEGDEENVEGDSDMAYLQSFVQRSKSSKEEKRENIATARILPKSFSKKRRSGSLNSTTSDAGSPMGKMTTPAVMSTTTSPRVPLGAKDANKSPSPSKKRKLKGLEEAAESNASMVRKKNGRLVAPDFDDLEPATTTKRKKRRKGMEADTDDVFNPNMAMNQVLTQRSGAAAPAAGGPSARRSTRIATVQKAEPAPIPVRLPGSIFADNGDMPAVSTVGITNAVFQRKVDKDLANETKNNTRKNRGGAVPVPMALASMAERIGERDEATMTVSLELEGARVNGRKNVRWDEVLTRVQGEESVLASPVASPENVEPGIVPASEPEKDMEDEDEDGDTSLPSPPRLRFVEPASEPLSGLPADPVSSQSGAIANETNDLPTKSTPSAPTRRSSRAGTSRLPKRGSSAVATPTPVVSTTFLPPLKPVLTPKPKTTAPRRTSLLPAPSSRVSKGGGRGGVAEEARVRLGMAGPGTPGPRRGGRRGRR